MVDSSSRRSTDTGSRTSLTLLQRVKKKDQIAWSDLVQLYGPLVYRLCRVAGIESNYASDVVQEVFQAVSRNVDKFRRDRPGDSFRGWLLVITKNKIRDHFRAVGRRPRAVGGSEMQAMVQQVPDFTWDTCHDGSHFDSKSDLMRRSLKLVQSDFAESTWTAFWKVVVDNQSPGDVADELGMSKWSVYQAKSRVLARLRTELGELWDD